MIATARAVAVEVLDSYPQILQDRPAGELGLIAPAGLM